MQRQRVAVVLFNDVEVLDFAGPFEVFSAVRLNEAKRREELSPFEVLTVAERDHPITAAGGLRVIPDHSFEKLPHGRHPRGSWRLGGPP